MTSLQSCAFVFTVAGTLTDAPACAQVKWNLVSAYPADNFHSKNLMVFAKDMVDVTRGRLTITVYPNASLFSAPMIMSAVSQAVETVLAAPGIKYVRFQVFDEVPRGPFWGENTN
jgi:TRAP-type C4-dicarboxylate transport system substrate-binding protein